MGSKEYDWLNWDSDLKLFNENKFNAVRYFAEDYDDGKNPQVKISNNDDFECFS